MVDPPKSERCDFFREKWLKEVEIVLKKYSCTLQCREMQHAFSDSGHSSSAWPFFEKDSLPRKVYTATQRSAPPSEWLGKARSISMGFTAGVPLDLIRLKHVLLFGVELWVNGYLLEDDYHPTVV